jgi:hypothetical protein
MPAARQMKCGEETGLGSATFEANLTYTLDVPYPWSARERRWFADRDIRLRQSGARNPDSFGDAQREFVKDNVPASTQQEMVRAARDELLKSPPVACALCDNGKECPLTLVLGRTTVDMVTKASVVQIGPNRIQCSGRFMFTTNYHWKCSAANC